MTQLSEKRFLGNNDFLVKNLNVLSSIEMLDLTIFTSDPRNPRIIFLFLILPIFIWFSWILLLSHILWQIQFTISAKLRLKQNTLSVACWKKLPLSFVFHLHYLNPRNSFKVKMMGVCARNLLVLLCTCFTLPQQNDGKKIRN